MAAPRWAMSLAGVALVFLALGWFGAAPVMRQEAGAVALRAISIAAVIAAAGLFLRSWRAGLVIGFAVTVVGLVGLWAIAAGVRDAAGPVGALIAGVLALFLALFGARRCRIYKAQNEPHAVALQRAIEDTSAGELFAAAGAVLATLPAALVWPSAIPMTVAMLAAGIGGIVWAPASSGALDALLPRHRPVQQVYASRKKSPA